MIADQRRFADTIDRLQITLQHLNGNVIALEHLLDECEGTKSAADPMVQAIRAVFDGIQFHASTADDQADEAWKCAAGLLARLERPHA